MTFDIISGPDIKPPRITPLEAFGGKAAVLRLDEVHPVISGNKWYKLAGYLQAAKKNGQHTIITFGGAYSNHIIATAAACKAAGLKAMGIIRGEASKALSPTLQDARSYGMELYFISRTQYREKELPASIAALANESTCLIVAEGGYGMEGIKGIAALYSGFGLQEYSHIMCAAGTGTTLAGFALHAMPQQQVLGISVLKNNNSLAAAVRQLLPAEKWNAFQIAPYFHFGGYAKYNRELLLFMNEWYRLTGIPTDFVYTGKLFYAFWQLWQAGHFSPQARILLVHSGGLQGNRSLPPGTLHF